MNDIEFVHAFIGQLEMCTKLDGDLYPATDWRLSYCGQRGLIAIYTNSYDMVIACFNPDGQRRRLQTTAGYLAVYEPAYVITTKNSIYRFIEAGIDEDESRLLCKTYEETGVPKEVIETAVSTALETGRIRMKSVKTRSLMMEDIER